MPYFRGASKTYPTTPRYNIPRSRYRDRYPSGGRLVDRVNERTARKPDKGLGMKAGRRKRYLDNSVLNDDDTNVPKPKPNIPPKIVSKLTDRSAETLADFADKPYMKEKLKSVFSKRNRRHVGPHDEDGLQRLLSTGTLAPSSLPETNPLYNNSMDFVFATYWFFPAKTRAILPQDQKCIEEKLSQENQRFDPKSE